MDKSNFITNLGEEATVALIEEAFLTPKPGLIDKISSGSHTDMNLHTMEDSANALQSTFTKIAEISYKHPPNQELREKIASIGREGEKDMLKATGGVNTHKGAIWALGLIISAKATMPNEKNPDAILKIAGKIASFEDRNYQETETNGNRVKEKYKVSGAKEEAEAGFPTIRNIAIPAYLLSQSHGKTKEHIQIDVLLSLMAKVDDTCILHRGCMEDLQTIKKMADTAFRLGGNSTSLGNAAIETLAEYCLDKRLSPGGSADLLAATIFMMNLEERGLGEWRD